MTGWSLLPKAAAGQRYTDQSQPHEDERTRLRNRGNGAYRENYVLVVAQPLTARGAPAVLDADVVGLLVCRQAVGCKDCEMLMRSRLKDGSAGCRRLIQRALCVVSPAL